jgi:hypothetical protein
MLFLVGSRWETDMPWPADPSRLTDDRRLGDTLVDVRFGVYTVEAVELATDLGDVFRCISAACDMPTGR